MRNEGIITEPVAVRSKPGSPPTPERLIESAKGYRENLDAHYAMPHSRPRMISYNLLAVGLAAAGRMNPLLAAILIPLSSLATLALVGWGMRGVWRGKPL